jgi:ribosomal protein S20
MADKKPSPSERTFLLWVKAGGRCEFMGCNKILYKDSFFPSFEYNLADRAHIVANSPDGPRGSKSLSKKLSGDISNLMLLCKECHKRIDANKDFFTLEKLSKMKKQHEERIERVTGIIDDCRTNIITYSANIGVQNNPVDINRAQNAVITNNMYPLEPVIDLSLSGHTSIDNEDTFWKIETLNLEKRFEEKLKDKIANKSEKSHYSVFALAPIPLLIKLGSLLTDKTSVQTYQKNREPDSWNWQEDATELEFSSIPSKTNFNKVALILSISALIADEDVYDVLGKEISIWKIEIENPNNDCIRNKSHLSAFRTKFRKVLNDIKAVHGADATINLFPTVPVSIAVEMGRVWMPKADLPFVIYDRNRGEGLLFIKTISIGDNNG